MAKKTFINLKHKNITFEDKNRTIKLLSFNKSNMRLEIAIYENNIFIKNDSIAFAHLPKSIKTLIKPL